MEDLSTWASLASPLLSLATIVYVFLTAGSKKAQTDIDEFKETNARDLQEIRVSLDNHGTRIQSIESEMKHLPDAAAFMDLRLAVSDIKGNAGAQAEVVNGIARTVHRMENFLLSGSKSE